ncbi:MAG: Ferredoxin-NADP reductase [Nocardioides sp.]|nr:Ferredoxin-NADP reductase [Nocardioides sp.]
MPQTPTTAQLEGAPLKAGELELLVDRVHAESDCVVSVRLVDPSGRELPAWQPGAHIDFCLPGLTRQYSLCGDPDDRSCYRIGVLREAGGRGCSDYIHREVTPGHRVAVRGPRNNFPLLDADRYLFVAGGIGITPLLPMVAEVESRGREWELVYGGRSCASMAFRSELAAYGSRVRVSPQDEAGLLDLDAILDVAPGTAVYCCGPEPLIAAVESECSQRPGVALHVERFGARPLPDGMVPTGFEVYCADSDVTVAVAVDESMLEALMRADLDLNYECMQGTCGSCELDVLEGEAVHLDTVLTPEEHAESSVVFPCVSRARTSRLVLDV